MDKQINITPMRMIRIAKDLTMTDMANYFMVTPAYIGVLEKNQRKIKIQSLKFGLDNLGISLDDYFLLENFSKNLLNDNISDECKYRYMLIKTLGVVNPELKVQTEELLEKYYTPSETNKSRKN